MSVVLPDIFVVMNIIGLIAFAVAGSIKAIKEGLDLFGITVLGVLTALGGGIIRDLLVNQIPNALKSYGDVSFAIAGVVLSIGLYRISQKDIRNKYFILIPDAIGLSAFTTTGAIVAYNADVSFFGILVLSTLTGVGGGMISDILLGKVPTVLKDDFYASCAVLGAVGFSVAIHLNMELSVSAFICALTVLVVRILAIFQRWNLPKFS